MDAPIHVVSVAVASDTDVLRISNVAAQGLLWKAAACEDVEAEWDAPVAVVEGGRRTDFLRVPGFPGMLAFRSSLLATSGLELYLENGKYLPVETTGGTFTIWHLPAHGIINALDRSCVDGDGTVTIPKFLSHRLPGNYAMFTTPEYLSRLFVQARHPELTPALGGPTDRSHPPKELRPADWRSFLLEYTWRGWTGLEFEIVWRSGQNDA